MQLLRGLIARVATSDTSVLLRGERGTGKESSARALHDLSDRCAGPFIAFDCAALPPALIERELFGLERPSDDASAAELGVLARAHGGTLFLDSVAELPSELQPKLLRALRERTLRPVGSTREFPFDARVVAASRGDLAAATAQGRFRADLFLLLSAVAIDVPPLRARQEDIVLLAAHFLAEFAQRDRKEVSALAAAARACLERHSWPGNVRELRACIEHAVAMARDPVVELEDLPPRLHQVVRAAQSADEGAAPVALVSLFEVERRHVLGVLTAVNGNKTKAAKILGIDRKTLQTRLVRYGYRGRRRRLAERSAGSFCAQEAPPLR